MTHRYSNAQSSAGALVRALLGGISSTDSFTTTRSTSRNRCTGCLRLICIRWGIRSGTLLVIELDNGRLDEPLASTIRIGELSWHAEHGSSGALSAGYGFIFGQCIRICCDGQRYDQALPGNS